jgi:hypothetical protein
MDDTIRQWIADILREHQRLLAIALRQRAKFEGWLKFELAARAEQYGATAVEVESASNDSTSISTRSDIAFSFGDSRYDLELKTPNVNWRMLGVNNRTRPITKNVASIILDARKLYHCANHGIVAFVLFPIPTGDKRWHAYLERIATDLSIPLTEQSHCRRVSLPLADVQVADVVICAFFVPRPQAVTMI